MVWYWYDGIPPGGRIKSYQTDTAWGGEGWHGGVFVRILSILLYINHHPLYACIESILWRQNDNSSVGYHWNYRWLCKLLTLWNLVSTTIRREAPWWGSRHSSSIWLCPLFCPLPHLPSFLALALYFALYFCLVFHRVNNLHNHL